MKVSRIDIIGQNGNDGEHYEQPAMCGTRWEETGFPWVRTEDERARIDFEESANFEPVGEA